MGMFDSIQIQWFDKPISLQTKEFSCTLENWNLGSRVDPSQQGTSFFIIDFSSLTDHIISLQQQQIFGIGNRFFIGVTHQGFWIDYAIAPTAPEAERLGIKLALRVKKPEWRAFLWQANQNISSGHHKKNNEYLYKFFYFFDAFKGKKNRKTHPHMLAILNKKLPSIRNLTVKKLVEAYDTFKDHVLNIQNNTNDYESYTRAVHHEPADYFYDGPKHCIPEPNPHNAEHLNQVLLDAIKNLDLSVFASQSQKNPYWWQHTSPQFKKSLETLLRDCLDSHLGTFLWITLRKYFKEMPLTDAEKNITYETNVTVTLWVHLSENLGSSEQLLNDAILCAPDILSLTDTNHPSLLIPSTYGKLRKTIETTHPFSHVDIPDDFGFPILHHCVHAILSYEQQSTGMTEALFWIQNGANPYSLDPEGNTPLMWLAIHSGSNVNYSWLWGDTSHYYYQKNGLQSKIIHALLENHPSDIVNKQGESLHTLWPRQHYAQKMWALEESKTILTEKIVLLPTISKKRL